MPARLRTLTQGAFEGASYVEIGQDRTDVRVSVSVFYPDSLVAGASYPVSISYAGSGGPGRMGVTRVSEDAIEGTFAGGVRTEGVGGLTGPSRRVTGGFHVAR